jgi:hypothetical protein
VGEILRRVCAESALLAAWEKVRDSAYADGDPGAGVAAFERGALRGLTAVAVELGRSTWRPGSVTAMEIPKPDGGLRRLAISSVEYRIVERAVLVELDRVVDPVPDRPTGERVLELAADAAGDLQLRLKEADTAVVAFDEGVRFCGEVVTATTGAVPKQQAHPLQGTVFVTTEAALLRTRGTGCGWRTATGCC